MIHIRMFTRRGQFDFHRALKSFLSIGEAEFRWVERDLTENLPYCPIDQTFESSHQNQTLFLVQEELIRNQRLLFPLLSSFF